MDQPNCESKKKRNGFFMVPNTIFGTGLKPNEFMVLCYFVSLIGAKNKCWPSIRTVAENCCMCENTARKTISSLIEKGIFTKVATKRKVSDGVWAQSNNEYFFLRWPGEELKIDMAARSPFEAFSEAEKGG